MAKLKLKFQKTTEIEIDAEFPIYLTNNGGTWCAIYSETEIYSATNTHIEKSGLKPEFWLNLLPVSTTKEDWAEQCAKAKEYQRQMQTDVIMLESMEQNPTMSDMAVKDYSPEREEEINIGVREMEQAEKMERNAEI